MTTVAQDILAPHMWTGKIYSNGWISPSGGTYAVTAPADGSQIATMGRGTASDLNKSATAARAAQPGWEATPATERAAILNRAADYLETNLAALVPWLVRESGSTPPKAGAEIKQSVEIIRAAATAATEDHRMQLKSVDGRNAEEELVRVAHGVVGVISAFNFPLLLSIRAIAAALATGNTVVHKPDPRTPISGGVMIAQAFEYAGLANGALHIVTGDAEVGAAMCEDPNIAMVSFTGSAQVGAKVAESCGRNLKKVQLELGGKNALIVLDDADLNVAASNCAWGAWIHQGQVCIASGLILAHEQQAATLADMLTQRAQKLPVGDPASDACALGPLIAEPECKRIEAIIDDALAQGATLHIGGKGKGTLFPATVLSGVRPGMRAFDEEIFGPVAVIAAYLSDEHAVELANMSSFGLAGAVIGADVERARTVGLQLRVGHLHINDQTVNSSPLAPFGGRGQSGNGGRISGPAVWEEFSQYMWITSKPQATTYPF